MHTYTIHTTLLALRYCDMFQPSQGHPQGVLLIHFHSKIIKIFGSTKCAKSLNLNLLSFELKKLTNVVNRAYYGLQNHMKSRIISRNTKTLLYKTPIRPVLTYGSETWVLSKQDEHRLSIFERKILRRIYGPVMDGGRW